jgi:hypothetical protein
MKRRNLPFAMALLLATGACGPAELVVTVEVDMVDPEGEGAVTRALGDLEVQLLPYDRDAIFDSLEAAYPEPEPEIPQELLQARDQVAQAQQRWQSATNRWNTLRDTLQKITDTMEQYNRGESRYVALFREFQEFDRQLGQVERNMEAAFADFDSLQRGTIRQSDSVRILQENWGDEAFVDFGEVAAEKLRESGLDFAVDTNDASGIVRIVAPPGSYWVHTRYEFPYSELYWNVPVTLTREAPLELRLTRENAQERVKL